MRKIDQTKRRDFQQHYPLIFTLIFVIMLFQYPFSTLEGILYDFRITHGIPHQNESVVVITLDEESDQFLGEYYPYTYATHLRFIRKLLPTTPKAITYLVRMPNPRNQLEEESFGQFQSELQTFLERDGKIGFIKERVRNEIGEAIYNPGPILLDFFQNFSMLEDSIGDQLPATPDSDVVRKIILKKSGEDTISLWNAQILGSLIGGEKLDSSTVWGAEYNREGDANYSYFRYPLNPKESAQNILSIPFHRILVGNFPKEIFKNKIVLIGPQYITKSMRDYVISPFDSETDRTPRLNVIASQIQSLVLKKSVYQMPKSITYLISILIAIFLSITISRLNPVRGLIITMGTILLVVLLGQLLFVLFGIWVYLSHMILSVFVVYYLLVPFRAIAEYQRRYAIQEETKLLKKVESLKQNFISLMSHDLKTPVAKIVAQADSLLRLKLAPEMSKTVHGIIDSTKELNKFITSILDLTKVESSNLQLHLVSKDVNTVIENIVESLRYEASEKRTKIIIDLAPLYPIQLDINLMNRVFSNIVENAIKYTSESSTILIKTWDDPTWVYIQISDNGVGMSKEDQENIFEKFYRVKNDANLKIKGSGLGLYLVKYFVELHGGKISVESELGKGSSFTIQLKNE